MTTAKARTEDLLEAFSWELACFLGGRSAPSLWDAIQEARDFASDYGDGFQLEDDGVFLFVSDHGNVTVYADDNGKPGAELWSVV
jgi:geranylgeranyl pyrophosphate synthase